MFCLGYHGHGFAWPWLRDNQSTATQSRDRGTLKASPSFSKCPSLKPERIGQPAEAARPRCDHAAEFNTRDGAR